MWDVTPEEAPTKRVDKLYAEIARLRAKTEELSKALNAMTAERDAARMKALKDAANIMKVLAEDAEQSEPDEAVAIYCREGEARILAMIEPGGQGMSGDKTICEKCGAWTDTDSAGNPWNHSCPVSYIPTPMFRSSRTDAPCSNAAQRLTPADAMRCPEVVALVDAGKRLESARDAMRRLYSALTTTQANKTFVQKELDEAWADFDAALAPFIKGLEK